MSDLTVQLRRLQYAANMLNVREFCDAQGWEMDDYAVAKFREFQNLGRLHAFSADTLDKAVAYYEAKSERTTDANWTD